ncbi:hypothetical protein KY336_03160 [Candidatus Woesearchaeota archaeon]|nr:hypothetical protein [Candidatus Woesearchaeota archaeon]
MKKKLLTILGIGLFFSFFIGAFTHDFNLAFKFGLAYFILYYLPLVPWMMLIKEFSDLDTAFYSIILGVIVSPLFYLAVGALEFRLTKTVFIAIPLIIFVLGFLMHFRRKKEREKPKEVLEKKEEVKILKKPTESPNTEKDDSGNS